MSVFSISTTTRHYLPSNDPHDDERLESAVFSGRTTYINVRKVALSQDGYRAENNDPDRQTKSISGPGLQRPRA